MWKNKDGIKTFVLYFKSVKILYRLNQIVFYIYLIRRVTIISHLLEIRWTFHIVQRPVTVWTGRCVHACPPVVKADSHRRGGGEKKAAGLPSDSGESAAMQSWTMCWIGSLYISLPFGPSNATLPYEGTSTRTTCSKQNTTGDRLQRTPPSSDCFSDRHSHLQES